MATRPPYMHAGQFVSLSEVLTNYRDTSGGILADEIFHDDLSEEELKQLEGFLNALTSLKLEKVSLKGGCTLLPCFSEYLILRALRE